MAGFSISLDSLKRMYHSQVHDPDKWATNMRVLRAAGMFLGSIVVMRNFGDYLVGEGGNTYLYPIPGVGVRFPFMTYYKDMKLYLYVSPWLNMKKLLVGGFNRVYEIGK